MQFYLICAAVYKDAYLFLFLSHLAGQLLNYLYCEDFDTETVNFVIEIIVLL